MRVIVSWPTERTIPDAIHPTLQKPHATQHCAAVDHEMDGIEWATLMVVLMFAIPGFLVWLRYVRLGTRFRVPLAARVSLWLTPLVAAAFLAFVLRHWAAKEIRERLGYILLLVG